MSRQGQGEEQGTSRRRRPRGGTPQQISVQVGQLNQRTHTVRGNAGMTVGGALQQANVQLSAKQTAYIRGQSVTSNHVLSDGDVLVVSGNVRGGVQ